MTRHKQRSLIKESAANNSTWPYIVGASTFKVFLLNTLCLTACLQILSKDVESRASFPRRLLNTLGLKDPVRSRDQKQMHSFATDGARGFKLLF